MRTTVGIAGILVFTAWSQLAADVSGDFVVNVRPLREDTPTSQPIAIVVTLGQKNQRDDTYVYVVDQPAAETTFPYDAAWVPGGRLVEERSGRLTFDQVAVLCGLEQPSMGRPSISATAPANVVSWQIGKLSKTEREQECIVYVPKGIDYSLAIPGNYVFRWKMTLAFSTTELDVMKPLPASMRHTFKGSFAVKTFRESDRDLGATCSVDDVTVQGDASRRDGLANKATSMPASQVSVPVIMANVGKHSWSASYVHTSELVKFKVVEWRPPDNYHGRYEPVGNASFSSMLEQVRPGVSSWFSCRPGQTNNHITFNLNEYLLFRTPGTYVIHVRCGPISLHGDASETQPAAAVGNVRRSKEEFVTTFKVMVVPARDGVATRPVAQ